MPRREITGRKPSVSADPINQASGPPDSERDHADAACRTQVREARGAAAHTWAADRAAWRYSIRQFCEAHNISVDTYFRLQRAGLGPVTMRVGGRTLISVEAAAAWRRDRELPTLQARRIARD